MEVYGLIGNPVGHSLSPPMHEAAYEAYDLEARYVTFEPAPDVLEAAIQGADALGISGLNVTIPFKQGVLEFVDPAPLADRIGAVNTIAFGDRVVGYNTDASGAVSALRHHDVALAGSSAVVVGAGGAGRAITVGLADAGCAVHVANRTESKAHAVADDLKGVHGHPLSAVPALLDAASILVNATSVGMDEEATPIDTGALHDGLTVMDAVYSPIETTLLSAAKSVGATTIDGGWMLLYQGVEAFEHWTDREAPVEAMNSALRDRLPGQNDF